MAPLLATRTWSPNGCRPQASEHVAGPRHHGRGAGQQSSRKAISPWETLRAIPNEIKATEPASLPLADLLRVWLWQRANRVAILEMSVLARLSPEQLENLRPHLRPIELEVKQGIYQPNQPIEHVYFVETGMISVVSVMEDGRSIEVGTIGREGVAGAVLLLGTKTVPYQYYVQIAGHGHRIDAAVLKDTAKQDEEFRDLILRCQVRVPHSNNADRGLQWTAFRSAALLPLDS